MAARPRFILADDLKPRAISGVVMVVLALAATWVGGPVFLIFWGLAAIGVAWEWQRLIGGGRLWLRVTICGLGLVAAAPWAFYAHAILSLVMLIAAGVAAGAAADSDRRLAAGVGALYAGAAMVAPALLRGSPTQGLAAMLWLYAIVWGTDIGAYFGGRTVGGPKLWPAISPGKTWSGALIGAVVSALLGALVALLSVPGGVRLIPLFELGLLTSALSQVGDLFESGLKRRAGVKDSSRLIPGHGGLMDRLDGFIVAAAFAAAVAWARSAGPWMAPGLFNW
ncbi:MAG TPA: phosphatidate cytidylyltransferase [Roseiarcus sp.]|nr:phosphatidate cytidylyltransferase [Roseiarcus sp.]